MLQGFSDRIDASLQFMERQSTVAAQYLLLNVRAGCQVENFKLVTGFDIQFPDRDSSV